MSIGEGREAAIRGLNAYREELMAHIQQMQENLRCVDKSIEILGAANGTHQSTTTPLVTHTPVTASRYTDLKPQAAVQLFLTENPNRWFKASIVAKELLARGMPKGSKAFGAAITGTLNRAVRKGFAAKEKQNGVYVYRLKGKEAQGGEGA